MRYAILSDIHSNLEALEAAVGYAKKQNVESWVVLGDTIGYGANPNECFEWVQKESDIYLMGNHEKAIIDPSLRKWFNESAREAIVWTDEVMDNRFKDKIKDIPYMQVKENITFAHGSPVEPERFHYLLSFEDAITSFDQMGNSICFVGHTHVPCCFCESEKLTNYLKPGIMKLQEGDRYILNPGSVGQPRDRDSRLAFGIFDDGDKTFEIVRLPYENEKAANKIRKAGLPCYLADRLL